MTVREELARLEKMAVGELVRRYVELHGEPVRTRHREYLLRKVAWRLQANAEGDLTERARRRARELADDADVRLMPPKAPGVPSRLPGPAEEQAVQAAMPRDPRIPPAGTMIRKRYKKQTLQVVVHQRGFEFEGQIHKTLSAVAKAISGTHVNGFRFFNLGDIR